MELELLHFYNEGEEREYIVLAEPGTKQETIQDAKDDGYDLLNSIEFEGTVTLPINRVLGERN